MYVCVPYVLEKMVVHGVSGAGLCKLNLRVTRIPVVHKMLKTVRKCCFEGCSDRGSLWLL